MAPYLRDAEMTILIKFAFWRGSGRGEFQGNVVPNAGFSLEIP